jgi:hypothetical protein
VLVALACPLMMMFMMRGMGGHGHGSTHEDSSHETDDRHDHRPTSGQG